MEQIAQQAQAWMDWLMAAVQKAGTPAVGSVILGMVFTQAAKIFLLQKKLPELNPAAWGMVVWITSVILNGAIFPPVCWAISGKEVAREYGWAGLFTGAIAPFVILGFKKLGIDIDNIKYVKSDGAQPPEEPKQ